MNRREHINAVQSPPTSWPMNADEQESTTGDPPIVHRKSHIPAWFFTLLCMFLLTTTTDTTISINTKPILCQAHATPVVYTAPSKYNCSFQLSDEKPGLDRATLQLFKRNIIKYHSTAKLCSRIKMMVQRLTYFASVSHRERISTRHLPVSQTQCEMWVSSKLTPDSPLVFTNHVWRTQKKTKAFWSSASQCCGWYTFKANNSIIFEGTVVKDHFQAMHSNLGRWSHCNYTSGTCAMADGSMTIWSVKKESSM